MYAFCNLHDVSWGTKGSDKAEALPTLKSKKGREEDGPVVEDTTKLQEDVDAAFKETVTRAVTKVEVKEENEKPTMDDSNKTFRTRLVGVWMLSNATLAVAIANLNGLSSGDEAADAKKLQAKQQIYFAVILYSTFGLALVRFVGVRADFFKVQGKRLTTLIYSVCFISSGATFSDSAVALDLSSLCRRCFTLEAYTAYLPLPSSLDPSLLHPCYTHHLIHNPINERHDTDFILFPTYKWVQVRVQRYSTKYWSVS